MARLQENWRDWLGVVLAIAGCMAALIWADGFPQLLGAIVLGFALTVAFLGWMIGGSAHSLPWVWGAVGERETGEVLEGLPDDWLVVHDVARRRGNWDHIVVGPPGVFMVESKSYARPSHASGDALRCGRLRTEGRAVRAAAIELKEEIGQIVPRAPYVHAVIAIWGDFEQRLHEENNVAHVRGIDLVKWLLDHEPRTSGLRLAELRTGVERVAAAANSRPQTGAARLQPSG